MKYVLPLLVIVLLTVNICSAQVERLTVSQGQSIEQSNVIAGSNADVLNIRYVAYGTDFWVQSLKVSQGRSQIFNRSIASVQITYLNFSGVSTTATQLLVNGEAFFHLNTDPVYVPLNGEANVQVSYNLASIGIGSAQSGDLVQALYVPDEGFRAVSGSGNTLNTAIGIAFHGPTMVVRGNSPVFATDLSSNTVLANGPAELHRFSVEAQPGATDVGLCQLTFWVTMHDAVPTSQVLTLSNFQIYEGWTYGSATGLQPALSGTDAFLIYDLNGQNLSNAYGHLYADTSSLPWHQTVTAVFYDDRLVPPGATKYFILKAIASNVNTGASSSDFIEICLPNLDQAYLPPLAADFHPEIHPAWGAVLDQKLQLDGVEYQVAHIWSDMTGTGGDFLHQQASWYEPSVSSRDYYPGLMVNGLGITRVLQSGNVVDSFSAELACKISSNSLSNYPNPFNPTTTISFTLAQPTHVTLSVFDINGRRVAALVYGWHEAGNHKAVFDGSGLSSGIYLAKLSAGGHQYVQKLMLVK